MPTTNFRAGDRVRGAAWFDEIAGAVGTVVEAVEVSGGDWAAQDLLVRFDRPVVIFDEPQWTFFHSAHNFGFVDESRAAPGRRGHRGGAAQPRRQRSPAQPTRRRLAHKQPPPPTYQACGGCRYPGYLCTGAEDEPVEGVADAPSRFEPFSGTPHRL